MLRILRDPLEISVEILFYGNLLALKLEQQHREIERFEDFDNKGLFLKE